MPPKKAANNIPPKNNKKAKFSATMPEFDDQSEHSSDESEHNDSSFEQESNSNHNNSDDMEVSQQSSSHHQSDNKKPVQNNKEEKSEEESEENSQDQEDKASSEGDQSSSGEQSQAEDSSEMKNPANKPANPKLVHSPLSSVSYEPQKVFHKNDQNPPHPAQIPSEDQEIPQQQVQTDDFESDSERGNRQIVNPQVNHEEEKKVETILEEKNEEKMEMENRKGQQSESQIYVPLKNDSNKVQEQKIELEGQEPAQKESNSKQKNQKPQEPSGQKKKQKKSKKPKKNPKALSPSPPPVTQPPAIIQQHIQQQKQQNVSSANQTEDQYDSDAQTNLFYEVVYPYLMGIGQSVLNKFMKDKKDKKSLNWNNALAWGTEISNTFLIRAFMDDVEGIDHLEEVENDDQATKQQKYEFIQQKLNKNKFYRKLQQQLNSLIDQKITPIPLGKMYFIMKKFKIIASCMIVEKKRNHPFNAHINTNCYWDKETDGRINFSSENQNVAIMLTVYGLEIRKKSDR